MRVLLDNGTPRGVAAALSDHSVEEARARGWDTLKNGELLDAAEAAGFDVFVTTDRNIRHQQTLPPRSLLQDRAACPKSTFRKYDAEGTVVARIRMPARQSRCQ